MQFFSVCGRKVTALIGFKVMYVESIGRERPAVTKSVEGYTSLNELFALYFYIL